jgi:hypothetical protein
MIECRDIQALLDRFQDVMPPLQLMILRERYNGKTLMQPKAVGLKLGMCDERVRTLEMKGLRTLQQLMVLEATEQPIIADRVALSLWEPWATLWAAGFKKYETRNWATAYRGELLIHAASYVDHELVSLANEEPFDHIFTLRDIPLFTQFPRKCIIGRCLLVDCMPTEKFPPWYNKPITDNEYWLGNYEPQRFAWIAEKHELFDKPIPCRGFQKLFTVPESVALQLPPRYKTAA